MDLLNEGEGEEYSSLKKDHRHAYSSQKINGNRSTAAATDIPVIFAHKEHNSYIDNYYSRKMQNNHKEYDWNTNNNKNRNNNLFKQHSYLRNQFNLNALTRNETSETPCQQLSQQYRTHSHANSLDNRLSGLPHLSLSHSQSNCNNNNNNSKLTHQKDPVHCIPSGKKLEQIADRIEPVLSQTSSSLSPLDGIGTLWEQYGMKSSHDNEASRRQIYLQLANKKLLTICFSAGEENSLTCGWLLSEAIRKIRQYQQDTLDFSEDVDSIVSLKSSEKNLALDYFLSQFDRPLKRLKDRSILAPYHADLSCKFEEGERITLFHFNILIKIGQGGFSQVYLARRKDNGQFVALKVIPKSEIIQKRKKMYVYNEKNAMMALNNNPYVVKFFFSFQTKKKLIFVLEYCPGGELFYHLQQVKRFSEDEARMYFHEILEGMEFLHSKKILYRDLKPENILMDQEGHLKIADFGLSKQLRSNQLNYTFCGSFEYMAPEMFGRKGHSYELDYYSLGVLLYELVAGFPPFYCSEKTAIMEKVLKKDVTFPSYFSKELKELIKQLLVKDPKKRLGSKAGIGEIKQHKWCQKQLPDKRQTMPIKPSLARLNFDRDYIDAADEIGSLLLENDCPFIESISNQVNVQNYNNNTNNRTYQENSFNDLSGLNPPPLFEYENIPNQPNIQNNNFNGSNRKCRQISTFTSNNNSQCMSYNSNITNWNNSNNNNNIFQHNNSNSFNHNTSLNSFLVHSHFDLRHRQENFDFLDFSFYGYSTSAATRNTGNNIDDSTAIHLHHKEQGTSNEVKDKQINEEPPEVTLFFDPAETNTGIGLAPLSILRSLDDEPYKKNEGIFPQLFGPRADSQKLSKVVSYDSNELRNDDSRFILRCGLKPDETVELDQNANYIIKSNDNDDENCDFILADFDSLGEQQSLTIQIVRQLAY